jgi:hypothetical protein
MRFSPKSLMLGVGVSWQRAGHATYGLKAVTQSALGTPLKPDSHFKLLLSDKRGDRPIDNLLTPTPKPHKLI